MNAMLQQFYCIPTFRYGILMADDYQTEKAFTTRDKLTIDDNVFHQLQKLFAYLDCSQRRAFSPREFCAAYKDSSKQRVDMQVQQDAYEFLNTLFDKMETSLKPTPFQGIIDSVFKGSNRCVFTCQGCGF
jgi:ubiquitin carboxyl-terminal hydrolase 34